MIQIEGRITDVHLATVGFSSVRLGAPDGEIGILNVTQPVALQLAALQGKVVRVTVEEVPA